MVGQLSGGEVQLLPQHFIVGGNIGVAVVVMHNGHVVLELVGGLLIHIGSDRLPELLAGLGAG